MTEANAPRTALVAGATGLIGRALVSMLLDSANYRRVHVLSRRAIPEFGAHPKLDVRVIDFARLPPRLPAATDVYVALGTTIGIAGSEAAFRHVDFDLVVAIARAAKEAGAKRLAVVSALGADPNSRVLYNRVKGEMQAAVSALGYASVVIAQPSLLMGDRAALGQPVRSGERWAQRLLRPVMGLVPRRIRPIEAGAVAGALLAAMLEARPGVRMLSSADMQAG